MNIKMLGKVPRAEVQVDKHGDVALCAGAGVDGPTATRVELVYPCRGPIPSYLYVGMSDMRAADDIRIHYDFTRDGWVIEQAGRFSWEEDDETCDPDFQEVAFIKAWGREENSSQSPQYRSFTEVEAAAHLGRSIRYRWDAALKFSSWSIGRDCVWLGDKKVVSLDTARRDIVFCDTGEPFGVKVN